MIRQVIIESDSLRRLALAMSAAAACAFGAFALTGCNTVEGAGEDIEAAGEGISDAADGD